MAIAVLVVVAGLIVGVAIELVLSKRHRHRRDGHVINEGVAETPTVSTLSPLPPRVPEPRSIDDGEGFRIIGPVEYEDSEAPPWERETSNLDPNQDEQS